MRHAPDEILYCLIVKIDKKEDKSVNKEVRAMNYVHCNFSQFPLPVYEASYQ